VGVGSPYRTFSLPVGSSSDYPTLSLHVGRSAPHPIVSLPVEEVLIIPSSASLWADQRWAEVGKMKIVYLLPLSLRHDIAATLFTLLKGWDHAVSTVLTTLDLWKS
jgi:hypothetical protein